MAQVIRPVGYTGTLQRLIWPTGPFKQDVVVHLWGAGGGGGGNDAWSIGGAGGGGGYSTAAFTVQPGDVLDLAIGGCGDGGQSSAGSAYGGAGGRSLAYNGFNSRNPPSGQQPAVYPTTNGAWSYFLNTFGVWESNSFAATCFREYTVYFEYTGYYYWRGQADNSADFYLDGYLQMSSNSFQGEPTTKSVYITRGNHNIRWDAYNSGGPGGVALDITLSYSGGDGGRAGPSGSSGGAGGSGGATVLYKNGVIVAVAGGGGGGGGAGISGFAYGQDAPGPNDQTLLTPLGQHGGIQRGDGGGGGAGGGGWSGGNAGLAAYGDQGGQAGMFGSSFVEPGYTGSSANPTGRSAAGKSAPGYVGTVGDGGLNSGGRGNNGFAVFYFDVNPLYVKGGGTWFPAKRTFVKQDGAWKQARQIWVKNENVWSPTVGLDVPYFSTVTTSFGVVARVAPETAPPPPPPMGMGDGMGGIGIGDSIGAIGDSIGMGEMGGEMGGTSATSGTSDGTSSGTSDGTSSGTSDGTSSGTSDGSSSGSSDGGSSGSSDGGSSGSSDGGSSGGSDGGGSGD